MNFPIKATVAAIALISATPAFADIVAQKSSVDQGYLVHANGGAADVGLEVTGDLNIPGDQQTNYVHFRGSTTATSNTSDANNVRMQNGGGQAELTGAILSGNTTFDLQSGDIFLSNNDGFSWIELAFTGVTADTVTFTLALLGENPFVSTFDIDHSPNGENKFAFQAINGELITNLHYALNGGTADSIRQVRIIPGLGGAAVPEPGTWAMMLIGFGGIGYSMRRRRRTFLAQAA
jgi:hypothetical protein